jgi:ABC-type dipeptide/oligopeptide/nickel transport system permease component
MSLLLYAGRRLLWTLPTFAGAMVVIFILTQGVPGDAAMARVGQYATADTISAVRREMGLDQPPLQQFATWVQHLSQGNFGFSWKTGNPVAVVLAQRLPATLELVLLTLLIAVPLGIGLGVLAAAKRGSWLDKLIQGYAVLGLGVPLFWLSLMSVYLFYFLLGWVSAPSGRLGIRELPPPTVTGLYTLDSMLTGNWDLLPMVLGHLVLPVGSLVFIITAPIVRMTYTCVNHELSSDYVRAAVAAGLPQRWILAKYALKNAMIPVVTLVGSMVRYLLAATVLAEIVFSWPGIGRYAIESTLVADLAPLQAVVLIVTAATLLVNILVDLSYYWFDPRIKVA